MGRLKSLIIHPDPQVREEVRARLSGESFIQVLGEAVTAFEALELLECVPYGAFFVSTSLPGGTSGLELAQMLAGRKARPALIFLAENESLAYQAFELGATDFLIWPVADERLARTVDRLRDFKSRFREVEPDWRGASGEESDEQTVQVPMHEDDEDDFMDALKQAWQHNHARAPEIEKLAVTLDGRTILIPYTQIIFIEAYEDYSYVHTASQKFLTSYRLKDLEIRLLPHRFFRVHRKYIVNLEMVNEIASLPGSNFMLRTAGRTRIELPISRRRISELKKILGF